MYPAASFFLRNLDNSIAIQVCGHGSEVKSKWRAQRMLRPTIRVCVKGSDADSMLRSSSTDTTCTRLVKIPKDVFAQSGVYIQSDFASIRNQN